MSDSTTRRALDELADIYLTGPAEPVRMEAARARVVQPSLRLSREAATPDRPAIEAVLLGHLPGYASPWVSQYAHHAGAEHGGAVLVRVHEQVELELFSDASEPPQGGELSQTMEALSGLAGGWLVLIDNPSSTTAPRRLAELPRWTLLSGADDAAIVAGFRMLKSLLQECHGNQPPHGIGVMFMGCDDEVAADALRRLNRAAAAFLESPIELVGARQRMQPVRRRYIGHYEMAAGRDPWTQVGAFLCELNELSPGDAEREPSRDLSADDEFDSFHHGEAPVFSAVKIDDAPAPATMPPRVERPASPMAMPFAPMGPVAVEIDDASLPASNGCMLEMDEPAAAASMDAPAVPRTLAEHSGLTAIEPRCPRQSHIEFALDEDGRMHLLLRQAAAGESVDVSLRQLMQARAWAVEHMDLLSLACRPATFAADAAPQIHLFTADVTTALPLADMGVCIHLLRTLETPAGEMEIHERLT